MQNSNNWKYLRINSEVHKLNSTFKILSLFIMLLSTFFINSFEDVLMVFSYLVLSLSYSGINIKIFLKEILHFKFFLLFILAVDIIAISPIQIILSDIFRIIFIAVYLSIFVHTTSINEIMYGIEKILDPLDWQKNQSFTLYFSLIFRFPYTYMNERQRINTAYTVRNIKKEDTFGDIFRYYMKKTRIIFNSSIKELNKMYNDMKLKLYGYGKSRTNYRLNRFSIKEDLILILNIIILFIVIFY